MVQISSAWRRYDYETFYRNYPKGFQQPRFPEVEPYDEDSLGKIPKLLEKYRQLEYNQILEAKGIDISGGHEQAKNSIEIGKLDSY